MQHTVCVSWSALAGKLLEVSGKRPWFGGDCGFVRLLLVFIAVLWDVRPSGVVHCRVMGCAPYGGV